ncbi:hypothetical protein AJ78_02362 [Emergomyces pasteurianus Ep9510]|uniref:Uncharacterized protein n=1 Tax=Emergomyces pasteurianus Ep9510 TaxID=1447872 RepID=A0A1J9QQL4_9EURO|nr:hypothetical protein AJ78_02362 [Emergomyces pasteurianus Ep9510]
MNLLKARVLQGHFNGRLNIYRSQLYDFAVESLKEAMKLVIGYLRSTSHEDTTLSLQMPIVYHHSLDDNGSEEVKNKREYDT